MTGITLGAAFLGGAVAGPLPVIALSAALLAWTVAVGRRPSLWLAALALVAAVLGAWRGGGRPEPAALPWAESARGVGGRVASLPTFDGRRQRFTLDVESVWMGERREPASGRLAVSAPAVPGVAIGDLIFLTGALTPLDDLPGGFAAYLRSTGSDGYLYGGTLEIDAFGDGWRRSLAAVRRRIDAVFARSVPGDAGALLAGLVTGDDHALSRERRAAFVVTGTTHLTAVSGSNVALLVAFASIGASGLRRRHLGWQVGITAAIWLYAGLVGFPAPAVRAALVATGAVFAVRAGRRPDLLTLLVLSGALMVAVAPGILWSLAFQLSFAASLGLVAVGDVDAPMSAERWLWALARATIGAQVATLPLLIARFGDTSLIGLGANLLVVPLVTLIVPLAFVAAGVGLALPALGEALAIPAGLVAEIVLRLVDRLGGAPAGWLALTLPSGAAGWLVGLMSAGLLALWSGEGRRWLGRTAREARGAGWRVGALLAALTGLTAVLVTVALFLR